MYNRIVLDFGHGWTEGKFDAGFMTDKSDEYSMIQQYGTAVLEAIEKSGVPFVVVRSRTSPGLSYEERAAMPLFKDLQVCLHTGQRTVQKDSGLIYHTEEEEGVAQFIADAIHDASKWQSHWGGVRVMEAVKPWMSSHSLHVEPFQLLHVVSGRHVDAIGEVIGNALAMFLRQRNDNLKRHFLRVPS